MVTINLTNDGQLNFNPKLASSLSLSDIEYTSDDDEQLAQSDTSDTMDEVNKSLLNSVDDLARGIIKTDKNELKEYTIILVGETGTGKTSLLSLFANILAGRIAGEYEFAHDKDNEAGGSEKHSQTNSAKLYEFWSNNGVRVRILDTPGLADTRGLGQDELHKASIAHAIKENISTLHAVIILANGTVPRLGVATDYALGTLSSIFPRTLAHNIGILFTNVASPLSWNFDQNSLPGVLKGTSHQFLIDNPLALWKKYTALRLQQTVNWRLMAKLEDSVRESYVKALEEVAIIFDWLDTLEPQPTSDIVNLHAQSQEIERSIGNALTRASQLANKKNELNDMIKLAEGSRLTMKQFRNYQSVITKQVWVQSPTLRHNTVCSVPDCYSNCHVPCNLIFTLEPKGLLQCAAMEQDMCQHCSHSYLDHRHYNSQWKQEDDTQTTIDKDAEKKYKEATRNNTLQKKMLSDLKSAVASLDVDMEESLARVGLLTESYAKLSLSGSFAGQVRKSVRLLETNLGAMQSNNADRKSVEAVEKSLESMKAKLKVVEEANAKTKEQISRPGWLSRMRAALMGYKQ